MIKISKIYESVINELDSSIQKRVNWSSRLSDKSEELYAKKTEETLAKKIEAEIAERIKQEQKDNIEKAKLQSDETGIAVEPEEVNIEEIRKEVELKYKKSTLNKSPTAGDFHTKILKIISAYTSTGMSEAKAKNVIKDILSMAGGYSLLTSLFAYLEYAPDNSIKDYIGKDLSFDDILNEVNKNIFIAKEKFKAELEEYTGDNEFVGYLNKSDNLEDIFGIEFDNKNESTNLLIKESVGKAPINKGELKDLFELDRGKTLTTILFSDVKYVTGHTNDLVVDDKKFTIKNIKAPLLIGNTNGGTACQKELIKGFKELNIKHNLSISIPEKDGIFTLNKYWIVDTIAKEFINKGVPKTEVIAVVFEAFKKMHTTGLKLRSLELTLNTFIGNKLPFDYKGFIERYFIFALQEYAEFNKLSYIMFKNNDAEKIYILDCTDVKAIIAIFPKLELITPKFNSTALASSQTFNITLK